MANVIKHKRGSGSDPGASDLVVGEVAIRTDTGKLFTKMDNGSVAEIAGGGSDIAINTLSSSSGTGGGSATFNGSAYRFTLSAPPSVSAYQLLVSINGVIQKPVAGTGQPSEGFSVDGNDIILGDAPATGSDFFILTFKSLGVSEPADNSVTSAKIADGAIVNADINASAAIARTKLANVDVVDDTSPQLGGDLDTNSFEILLDDNHAVKFGDGADLQLYHSGTHSYIKNKTGNLYLMTTNTEYGAEFHADGAVKLNYDNVKKFETTSDGTLTSGAIRTNAATSGAASANQAVFDYNTSDTRILSYNSSGSSISLFTNPNGGSLASRLYIDSSGNVGIGTTSPSGGKLHVVGSGNTGIKVQVGSSSADQIYLGNTGGASSVGTLTNVGFNLIQNGGVALAVNTSKNVGIGTTSPSNKLVVNSPAHDDGLYVLAANNNQSTRIRIQGKSSSGTEHNWNLDVARSADRFGITNGVSTHLAILDGGNVGIGTTSPSTPLHIKNPSSTACRLVLENTGSGSDDSTQIWSQNNDLAFNTNDSERMRIDSSGRVGINQTSFATSDTMLSISELTGHLEVGLLSKNDSACVLNFGDPEDYNIGRLKYAHDDNSMRFDVNATERMRLDSSGRVGIGTTTGAVGGAPSSQTGQFNVVSSAASGHWAMQARADNAAGNGLFLRAGNSSSYYTAYLTGYDENNVHMVVRGDGNVGIGTSSPSYPLEVRASSGDANMRLRTDGTGAGDDTVFRMQVAGTTQDNFIYFGDSADSNAGYINYNHENDYLRIFTNAGERLRINSEGIANIWGKGSSFATQSNHHAISNNYNSWIAEMVNTVSGGYGLQVRVNSSSSGREGFNLYSDSASQSKASIMMHGGFLSRADDYAGYSDVKLKENIVDAKSQWDDVKAIKVRNFNWKDNPDQKLLGVVAQELEIICPNLIHDIPDKETDKETGEIKEIGTVTKAAKYSILHMKAFKALQEAMAKIETLETKVAALEAK